MAGRQATACLLSLLLVSPAFAAESVGFVLQALHAQVQGTALTPGTTILSESRIAVGPGGVADISLPGLGTLRIPESSLVQVFKTASETKIELLAGRALFCFSSASSATGREPDSTLTQPAGQSVSLGKAESQKIKVVRAGGKSVALDQGQCVELTLTGHAGPSGIAISGKQILIYGGIAAAILTLASLAAGSHLTRPQQQDLVSPFRIP